MRIQYNAGIRLHTIVLCGGEHCSLKGIMIDMLDNALTNVKLSLDLRTRPMYGFHLFVCILTIEFFILLVRDSPPINFFKKLIYRVS